MKLIQAESNGLIIPMFENDANEARCTTRGLCSGLKITETQLRKIQQRHPGRFHPLSVSNCHAKEFLSQHRAIFGIQRLREDMLLWSLEDALAVAFHVHNNAAWEFHKSVIQLLKEQVKKTVITAEMFEALEARMDARIAAVERQARATQPTLDAAASAAGMTLNAQKKRLSVN